VYLWHEILHSYFDNSDINHAIIELITDEELRCFLNHSSYPPFVGHKHLKILKKKLLSKWKIYTNSNNKDIKHFISTIKSNLSSSPSFKKERGLGG